MIQIKKSDINLIYWNRLSDYPPEHNGIYRVLYFNEHPKFFDCQFLRYENKRWYYTYNISIPQYRLTRLPVYWQNEDSNEY